jgi:pleiotropic regulator 1
LFVHLGGGGGGGGFIGGGGGGGVGGAAGPGGNNALVARRDLQGGVLALGAKAAPKVPVPEWHAPWKLKSVVAGHLGWVRCIAFEPANQWFVTGAAGKIEWG